MTTRAAEPWNVGTGVAGYAWPADRPRGLVLLQHGYAEYAERFVDSYSGLIPVLNGMGLSVFAFDIRGHGGSPGERCVTDLNEAVRDHLAARRALSASTLPLCLIGHSMGGLVTAGSVLQSHDGIAGVILSSPGFARSRLATRLLVNVLARLRPGMGVVPPEPPEGLSRDPGQVRRFVEDRRVYRGRVSALLAASGLKLARQVDRQAARWSVPTLIVHGSADRFCAPTLSVDFVERISSSDRRLEMVEGGYHELLNDTCAAQVLPVLTSWLDLRLGQGPVSSSGPGADQRSRPVTNHHSSGDMRHDRER